MKLTRRWHPGHKNDGRGRMLLKTTEDHAKTMQCNKIQVSTMAFQGVEFYQRMGSHQVGCIRDWFFGADEYFL